MFNILLKNKLFFVVGIILISLPVALDVFATVTVTPATGGSAISADTTGGTYTVLTGPIITEGATADISTGTIILNAPAGFVFRTTTNSVTVTRTNAGGFCAGNRSLLISGAASRNVTPTATTITITISRSTSSTCRATLTWSGIAVRPSAGTPLASGNITKSGTSSINGVTGSTNLGTLTEVHGAKTQVVFTTQPSSSSLVDVDFATKPVIAVRDQFGNTATSDNTSAITLTPKLSSQTCAGTSGSGTITSTPTSGALVSAGILTYTAMRYSAAEDIKICATSPGLTSALSNTISITNPVPATTSIFPNSAVVGSSGFVLTVNGSNFVSSSVVRWNGFSRTTAFVNSGQLTAQILASDISSEGTSTVTVFNPSPGGGVSNGQTFNAIFIATKFVILNPVDGTVDDPITITVQAQKPNGSVDTNYQNDVTLNVDGSATGGGLVSIINGVGTKQISNTVAETVNLTLSDSEATGLDVSSSQDVIFSAGAVSQFVLDDPANLSAGDRAAYTVQRKDQYNNLLSSGNTTVYLYSTSSSLNKKFYDSPSGGSIITSIIIPDGQSQVSFWYYDENPGTWTITASDNSSSPDGNNGVNDSVDSLIVVPGATAQFILNDPGDMTEETRVGYIITRKDQFNNLVTSGSDVVYLYSTDSTPLFYDAAVNGNSITFVNIPDGQSQANFWYYGSQVGIWTITASDNSSSADGNVGIDDGVDAITVSPIPIVATKFVILQPTDGTVDNPITVTVQAQNDDGDLDTTYQSDVTLVAGGSATGGGLVDIVNGVGTKQISDANAETVNLSLVDSQSTGLDVSSTKSVIFAIGAVAQFSLNNPGDLAAGNRIGYTVVRKDQFGNLVTSGATSVYLYSSSSGVNKKFYDSASGGSVITFIVIPDGQSQADFWYYDEKVGAVVITVSDNAVAPDGSAGIFDVDDGLTIQAGSTAKFSLNDPGDMTVGTRLGYSLSRKDLFDNPVTSGVSLAYLYSSSGASAKFFDSAVAGNEITFIPINDGQSQVSFWYYDLNPGIWNITVSDSTPSPNGPAGLEDAVDQITVSSIPIVATRFKIIIAQSTSLINSPVAVSVQAQDDDGNIDTTYQNDVTLNVNGSATGGGLINVINGVGSAFVNDLVAETVSLSLSDSQSTGLNVSSQESITFSLLPVPFLGAFSNESPREIIKGVKISGKAFPRANISIVAVGQLEQEIRKSAQALSNSNFSITFSDIPKGARSYAIIASDQNKDTNQTKIIDANLTDGDLLLSLEDVLLSPTLSLLRSVMTKGDYLVLTGHAVGGYNIEVSLDDALLGEKYKVNSDGSYKILISTANLSLGSHVVKVRQSSLLGQSSDFTPQEVFNLSNVFIPKTDFNEDGSIDIRDWSVFLSRWISLDPNTRNLNDLNGDGKIDISDFSIFTKTLKR